MKELKLRLKNMKNEFPENINEIKRISSIIRQKLKSSAKITAPEPTKSNLNGKFYKNFWKSCQEFFESNEGSKPTFSVARCYNYFKSVMCEKIRFKNSKHHLGSKHWMLQQFHSISILPLIKKLQML